MTDDQPGQPTVAIPGTIACRPADPAMYPGPKRAIWLGILAGGTREPPLQPGSEYRRCKDCSIVIAVGSEQQELLRDAQAQGVEVTLLCMVCAVMTSGGDVGCGLGNLHVPRARESAGDGARRRGPVA